MKSINERFYDILLTPLEALLLAKRRKALMRKVSGHVLEIGTGTGVNFAYYPYKKLKSLDLVDIQITEKVKHYVFPKSLQVRMHETSVETLPYNDNHYDYVVFTLVFCSVPNPVQGFKEIMRVLKPGGKILFIEHVLPHHHHLRKIFHAFTPTWKQIAHGCHLNRETLKVLKKAGFTVNTHERFLKGTFISGIGIKPQVGLDV